MVLVVGVLIARFGFGIWWFCWFGSFPALAFCLGWVWAGCVGADLRLGVDFWWFGFEPLVSGLSGYSIFVVGIV